MNGLFGFLSMALALTVCSSLQAQDVLYLQKSVENGKVTDISYTSVKYLKKTSSYLVPSGKILFMVNPKGDFLVPAQMGGDTIYDQMRIAHFLAADTQYVVGDKLFYSPDSLLVAPIAREDGKFVYLSDLRRVDKRSLTAVIYANGTIKLFASADKVAGVLGHFQHPPATWVSPGAATPSGGAAAALAGGGQPAAGGAASGGSTTGGATTGSAAGGATSGGSTSGGSTTGGATTGSAAGGATAGGSAAPDTSAEALKDTTHITQLFSSLAPDLSEAEFAAKATKKTRQFTDYLGILCTKSSPESDKDKAVDQAITLFINEDARVEVQSVNNMASPRYKIRQYLTRLRFVQYDKIEVEWTNIQYVSHLIRGDDGNYYGNVTFEQKFSAYRDGRLVYRDITMKNAKVILKTYEKSYEGTTQTLWDVLLGDVSVKAIKSF